MITKHYFSFCAKGLFQMDPRAAKEHTGMMNNVLERINTSLHLISGRHRIYLEFHSLCRSISLTSEPFTSCWRDHHRDHEASHSHCGQISWDRVTMLHMNICAGCFCWKCNEDWKHDF